MLQRIVPALLATALFAGSVSAATFTVTTTAGSGPGSFDQAILDANATPGLDQIHFNVGGGGPQVIATGDIPAITDAVVIDGTTQPGFAGTPIVTLDGDDTAGSGLLIQSPSPSTIRGLVIIDMLQSGIRVETGGAVITGNYIGVNASGLFADGNAGHGISVQLTADGTVITGNVISANQGSGISLGGDEFFTSDDNVIQGNIIGLDAQGVNDLGNRDSGIIIVGGNDNQIGGTGAGEGNVLSGNGLDGILINAAGFGASFAVGNTIEGNRIGTNLTGTAAVPNNLDGISLNGATQTIVGGSTAGARNVISGNGRHGVSALAASFSVLRNTTDTVITGNFIGTDVTGTAALGNDEFGILLAGAVDTTIGGAAAGAGNVISSNGSDGVGLHSGVQGLVRGTTVQGNRIGTDVTGTAPLPNAGDGVSLSAVFTNGTTDNTIGGEGAGEGNQIWFNAGDGIVAFAPAAGNPFLGNSIDQNGGLGIDLDDDGVTPNDAGDADAGANNRQNYPVLTAVTTNAATTVAGTLNSTPARTFRIEFFASPAADPSGFGEGRTFLGFTNVTTDGAGNTAISAILPGVAPGTFVTATATDQTTQDTSEFSNAVAAVFAPSSAAAVPTLAEWLAVLLAALLALGGALALRGSSP